MAFLQYGVTKCPLCGELIAPTEPLVVTSHFIADETDDLWRFSDAAIHRKCFLAWPNRDRFVTRFNREAAKTQRPDGAREQMASDGTVTPDP